MLPILLTGLLAGLVHVLSGPDHLAAVAPLALQHSRRRWLVGVLWGGGHTAAIFAVAALSLMLRALLPLNELSSWSDRLVGMALIAIGVWGLRQAFRQNLHVHRHVHDGLAHSHIHFHPHADAHEAPRAHAHTHVSFAMGTLHGLAGSAYVLGVLPALTLPNLGGSLVYLSGFGIGSIAAMGAVAWLLGASLERMERAGLRPYRLLLTTCSGAAIVIGAVWLVF
ncbi:MAG TPA: High-affinity nickel transporter [bacterium]|nr:High-affinity nickel transporter [bacterium]